MLGTGLIKGLAETAKNFIGSYSDPERLVTVQYPEERLPLKENTRNFPFLVFDGNDSTKGLRCVACKICEKECPPQCIYIVLERDEKGKPQKHPRVFDIDISVCMSCQICVEVCPFDAIKMDQVYELSRFDRFDDLLLKKKDLAKSNDYYRSIHPTEANDVDARLAEEKAKAEAAKAKAAAPAPKPVMAPAAPASPVTTVASQPAPAVASVVAQPALPTPAASVETAKPAAAPPPAESPKV
ncbi:MAG TPA: 4Fe-4S dicluster domain-containing protein [Verrucomicrobiae bacterium]|jgi:NADH-quinone oxidoreductase subunit I|nr:4Fe-4S dicluster domain-containing protein [Verrucomicrobiae bacterium]